METTSGPASSGWQHYRQAWQRAGEARDPGSLQQVVQGLPQLEAELKGLVDEPLRQDLLAMVRTRAADRRAAVAPPRGDLPGPDRAAEVRQVSAQLEQAHRALQGLRRLGWKDPWIEERLARYAAFLASVVEAQAGQLELEEGKATDLTRSARQLVERVAPTLPPIPR
jgi:hypothetical protein